MSRTHGGLSTVGGVAAAAALDLQSSPPSIELPGMTQAQHVTEQSGVKQGRWKLPCLARTPSRLAILIPVRAAQPSVTGEYLLPYLFSCPSTSSSSSSSSSPALVWSTPSLLAIPAAVYTVTHSRSANSPTANHPSTFPVGCGFCALTQSTSLTVRRVGVTPVSGSTMTATTTTSHASRTLAQTPLANHFSPVRSPSSDRMRPI